MTTKSMTISSNSKKVYQLISLAVYILAIIVTSMLLLVEPEGFDIKMTIILLVIILFISSLGIGQKLTEKSETKILSTIGKVAVAILLTFIGLFAVAVVGWCIGVYNAQ